MLTTHLFKYFAGINSTGEQFQVSFTLLVEGWFGSTDAATEINSRSQKQKHLFSQIEDFWGQGAVTQIVVGKSHNSLKSGLAIYFPIGDVSQQRLTLVQ